MTWVRCSGGGVAVSLAGGQDDGEKGAERLGAQAEVDEAGPGGLGIGDIGGSAQVLDQGGGDLGRRLAGGLGRDHGGVGGHVAVRRVPRRGDFDAGGYVGRESGDGLGQSGENGFAQARVEVGFAQVGGGCGRVHERGVSADRGGGSMVAVVLGGAGFALIGRLPAT